VDKQTDRLLWKCHLLGEGRNSRGAM